MNSTKKTTTPRKHSNRSFHRFPAVENDTNDAGNFAPFGCVDGNGPQLKPAGALLPSFVVIVVVAPVPGPLLLFKGTDGCFLWPPPLLPDPEFG